MRDLAPHLQFRPQRPAKRHQKADMTILALAVAIAVTAGFLAGLSVGPFIILQP